jgi:hypothetical protein
VFHQVELVSGEHVSVELTVIAIEAYGHALEEIDEGLSARLALRGTGAEVVEDRAVLMT